MHGNHAKAIKGMSIAALVLSALCIISYLACIVFMNFASDLLYSYGTDYPYYLYNSDDGLFDMSNSHGHGTWHDFYYPYDYDYGYDSAMMVLPAVMGLINAVFVFAILCSAVSLVASIIGLRLDGTPEKMRSAFVWFVIGAVAGGIALNIPVTVLFIIMAVFVNMDRKALGQMYAPPSQPYGGYAPSAFDPGAYGTQTPMDGPASMRQSQQPPYSPPAQVACEQPVPEQQAMQPPACQSPEHVAQEPVAPTPLQQAAPSQPTASGAQSQNASDSAQAPVGMLPDEAREDEEIDVIIDEADEAVMVIEEVEVQGSPEAGTSVESETGDTVETAQADRPEGDAGARDSDSPSNP